MGSHRGLIFHDWAADYGCRPRRPTILINLKWSTNRVDLTPDTWFQPNGCSAPWKSRCNQCQHSTRERSPMSFPRSAAFLHAAIFSNFKTTWFKTVRTGGQAYVILIPFIIKVERSLASRFLSSLSQHAEIERLINLKISLDDSIRVVILLAAANNLHERGYFTKRQKTASLLILVLTERPQTPRWQLTEQLPVISVLQFSWSLSDWEIVMEDHQFSGAAGSLPKKFQLSEKSATA